MTNETTLVIWFVAPSCHGKTTTVSGMIENEEHVMHSKLGTEDREVVLGSPIENRPDDITEEIERKIEKYRKKEGKYAILVDWQATERKNKTIEQIANQYPEANNQIVFLACDLDEVIRRCRQRDSGKWEKFYTRTQAKYYLKKVGNYVKHLHEDLDLNILCFDTSQDYTECNWKNKI